MSFPTLSYTSVIDYFNGGYWASSGVYPFFYYTYNINPRPEQQVFYYDAYGQMVLVFPWPGGGVRLARFDPAFVNNQSGSVIQAKSTVVLPWGWNVGEWDQSAGTQKLYASYSGRFAEIDPATMTWKGTYDYASYLGPDQQRNGRSSGTDGHFYFPNGYGQALIFESMGYALYSYGRAYNSSYGGYHGDVMFTASLTTGDYLETIPIPVSYNASPTAWERPLFMGEGVYLQGMQFIPDADSTPTAPKGYLLLHESDQSENSSYIKVCDWNPTDAESESGIPTRVHCQERFMSLVDPNDGGLPDGLPWIKNHPVLAHGTTGKMYMYSSPNGYTATGAHTLDDHCVICEFGTSPTPAIVSPPAFSGRTVTNRTIQAIVHVAGDLGEPIGGLSVAFSAKASSAKGELLENAGVGGVVYVDNPPIDEAGTTTVYEDGVELETNWSVTGYDTGEVTFTSPKQLPGSVYTIDYRHSQNPQAGSRVNLLTPAARTDETGRAACSVRIDDDDDLVGEWDEVTATVET